MCWIVTQMMSKDEQKSRSTFTVDRDFFIASPGVGTYQDCSCTLAHLSKLFRIKTMNTKPQLEVFSDFT